MKNIGYCDEYIAQMDKFDGFKDFVRERRTLLAHIIEETVDTDGQINLDRLHSFKKNNINTLSYK